MDTNQDGVISWAEFRASVFGGEEEEPVVQEQDLPDYLLGGSKVPGLGTLLGDALALLCVARYGLLEDELWALLGDLDRERKEDLEAYEKRQADLERERLEQENELTRHSVIEPADKEESLSLIHI